MGRVSGDPAYVAAYGIAVTNQLMEFPVAYLLTRLVIHELGGPVRLGKAFPKRLANALEKNDLVMLYGKSAFTHESISRVSSDDGSPGVLVEVFPTSGWDSDSPTRTARFVLATDKGKALVEQHLPKDK